MIVKELIEDLRKRLEEGDWFLHEADPIEWTDPKYCHQN